MSSMNIIPETNNTGYIGSADKKINTIYVNNVYCPNIVKGLSVSGKTITYTKGDGTSGTLTTQDTTYSAGSNITLTGTTFSLTKDNVISALGYTPTDSITSGSSLVGSYSAASALVMPDRLKSIGTLLAGLEPGTVTAWGTQKIGCQWVTLSQSWRNFTYLTFVGFREDWHASTWTIATEQIKRWITLTYDGVICTATRGQAQLLFACECNSYFQLIVDAKQGWSQCTDTYIYVNGSSLWMYSLYGHNSL